MDPIALITAALAAGAVTGAQETTTQLVKDAYNGLKTLVQRRVKSDQDAEIVIAKPEEVTEEWETSVRDVLVKANAAEDIELVQASHRLLSLIDPQNAAQGKYNVQITGNVQGLVQGDNANVSMSFDDTSSDKSAGDRSE